LRELGSASGLPSYLILGPNEIQPSWFEGVERVGITSGASTPEVSVTAVVDHLRSLGAESVEETEGTVETVEFQLPPEVR
jgi:4-hydroxy-3-methylbut-2-enyl diphosphate reductase